MVNVDTPDVLLYWQRNRAAAHNMARMFIEDGDLYAAIQWQEYGAHCHRCFMSNLEHAQR